MAKIKSYWIRRLANSLLDASPVERVRTLDDCIQVWYKTGFRRSYAFRTSKIQRRYRIAITQEQSRLNWPVEITFEFERNPLEDQRKYEPYFFVSRNTTANLSLMEQEVLVQEIMFRMAKYGYVKPYISDVMVDAELERIANVERIFQSGHYSMAPPHLYKEGKRPGFEILFKYHEGIENIRPGKRFSIRESLTSPRALYTLLHRLIRQKQPISISTLHYRSSGPKWANPAVWTLILRQMFKPEGKTLVDVSPNLNENAICASLLGCKYAPLGVRPPEKMRQKLGIELVEPREPYDLAVLNDEGGGIEDLSPTEISDLIAKSENLIAFIPGRKAKEFSQFRPSKIIKVRKGHESHYLFIWSKTKI